MVFFIFAAAIAIVCFAVSVSAILITRFREETRELCDDMDSAATYEQYMECLRALRCHYLKLIPFVTDLNVGKVYDRIYRKEKTEEKLPRREGFVTVLAPSLIGICLCIICLCGISFAWFTNSISSGSNKIQAANYYVDITVDGTVSDSLSLTDTNEHTAVIKVNYNATASTGYVVIKTDSKQFVTAPIGKDTEFTVYIKADSSTVVTFEPHWGAYNGGTIYNGDHILF